MLVVMRKALLEEMGVGMKMGVELKLARLVWWKGQDLQPAGSSMAVKQRFEILGIEWGMEMNNQYSL